MTASTQTILDGAHLSQLVYQNTFGAEYGATGGAGEGWRLVSRTELGLGGLLDATYFDGEYLFDNFNAQAFVARRGSEVALVFRGTEVLDATLIVDAALPATLLPYYALFGRLIDAFTSYASSPEISAVRSFGHSLGGALAEYFSVLHPNLVDSAVTFGSPGISTGDALLGIDDPRITNLEHEGDPVPVLPGPLLNPAGVEINVDLPTLGPGISEHKIARYLETARMLHDSGLWDIRGNRQIVLGSDTSSDTLNLSARKSAVLLIGGGGVDNLYGTVYGDLISGGSGSDDLRGQTGADSLYGGASFDFLYGGTEDDRLFGGDGFDYLYGEQHRDTLYGGIGSDNLYGGDSGDSLYGDEDDDRLSGEAGDDLLNGGAGTDTAVFVHNWECYKVLSGRTLADFRLQLIQFEGGTDQVVQVEKLQFANRTFNTISEFFQAQDDHWTVTQEPDPLPVASSGPVTSGTTVVSMPLVYVNNIRASVVEGDSGTRTATFDIVLSSPTDHPITFIWSAIGGTSVGQATSNQDFKFGAGTVTIPAGQVNVSVPVTIYGDTAKETNESFNFLVTNLVGAQFAGGGTYRSVTGWIIDDDTADAPPPPPPEPDPAGPVYLSIEARDPSAYEGSDGTFVEFDFTVRRTGDLDQRTDYKIAFSGYGGTPLTADDFYDGKFPVEYCSFGVGETRDTFTVRVKSDSVQEAHEYFRAKLTSPDSNAIVSQVYAYSAVMNDDGSTLPSAAGEVYLTIRPVLDQVVEGTGASNTAVQFEVIRTGDLNQVTDFRYSFDTSFRSGESPDTITNTHDGVSGSFSPWFNVGQSSYIITKYLTADAENEPDEYLTARLRTSSSSPNVVLLNETASTLVVNDDGPAPPRVTAAPGIAVETDGVSTAYVRVSLDHVTSADVSMTYAIGGTFAGTDYVARTGSLTISAGQLYADIAVQILGDTISEPLEYVEIQLGNVINGYFGHSNLTTWDTGLVIADDDQATAFPINAADLAKNAIDLGALSKYEVINHQFILEAAESTLVYRLEATEAMTIDTDSPAPPLIFDAAGRLIHANIASFDYIGGSKVDGMAARTVFAPGEYFLVYSGAFNPEGVDIQTEFRGMPSLGDVPLVNVHFSTNGGNQSAYSGEMIEGSSGDWYRYVVVELSHPVDYDVSFDVAVNHLTTDDDDFDYATTEHIVIAAGDSSGLMRIVASNDTVFEGTEAFSVTVSNVSGALLPDGAATFTRFGKIVDNDENPNAEFGISAVSLDRVEGSSGTTALTFLISRPVALSGSTASVDWELVGTGISPISGQDFQGGILPKGVADFAAGESEKLITISVIGDHFSEANETFSVTLSNPSSGFGIHDATADGVIRNDDGIGQSPVFGNGTVTTGVSYVMQDADVDAILVGGSVSYLTGNALGNAISGNNAANDLQGGGGDDRLFGRDGNDRLDGGTENDEIWGESGDDTLIGQAGRDTLLGGDGQDLLNGGLGNDYLDGGAGVDRVLFSGSLGSTVNLSFLGAQATGYGSDILVEIEDISSGTGNDRLTGNAQSNNLNSGAGNDTLSGLAGDDSLFGGAGNDLFIGGAGNDLLDGGTGVDRVDFSGSTSATINLGLRTAQNTGYGTDTILYVENVTSGSGNDVLTGNGQANNILSGAGKDTIVGGAGNDTLNGGLENDTLTGGSGRDVFVFSTSLGLTNIDRIWDYNVADDTIRLDDAVFVGLATGGLAVSAFVANVTGAATDTLHRIIYETDTGKLYFDADGSGAGASIQFASLAANLGLASADFFVF